MYKTLKRLLLAACLASTPALAQGVLFTPTAQTIGQVNGTAVLTPEPGAYITVCQTTGVNCTATMVYSDGGLTQPLAQPFQADAQGNVIFWAAPGNYKYTVTPTDGSNPQTYLVGGGNGQAPATTVTDFAVTGNFFARNFEYGSIDTFGNSLTQGTGATTFMEPGERGKPVYWPGNVDYGAASFANGPTAFSYLLEADFGNGGHNYGRGGDTDVDVSLHVAKWAHPTLEYNPVRTDLEGTNDVSVYGTNPDQQDTVQKAILYSIAQGVIPDSLKTLATQCTASGAWTADVNLPGALIASSSGASLSCPATSSSSVVYVAYKVCDNAGSGSGAVEVNGSAGSIEPTITGHGKNNSSILTASGSHCGLALARNTGVAGSNTVTITTASNAPLEVYWVGGAYTAPIGAIAPPIWIQGGTQWEQNDQREPATGQYNAIDQQAVTTMQADGNNVRFADVRAYLNTTTDYVGGGGNGPDGKPWASSWNLPLHPGDRGHYDIYRAFRDQLPGKPLPSQALSIYGGPFGYISGANSLGGRYGADANLTGAAVATTLTLGTNGAPAGSAGLDFEVADSPNGALAPYTLRYWTKSQYNAPLSMVFGLENKTTKVFPFLVDPLGTFCTQVAETNAGNTALANPTGCLGSSLYAQQNGQVGVASGYTSGPGVINGLDHHTGTSDANLKVQTGTGGRTPGDARITVENTSGGNSMYVLSNPSAPAGSRVWRIVLGNGGQLQIQSCDDAMTDSICRATQLAVPGGATQFLGVKVPSIASQTGTRYICVDSVGNLISQTVACSGT